MPAVCVTTSMLSAENETKLKTLKKISSINGSLLPTYVCMYIPSIPCKEEKIFLQQKQSQNLENPMKYV